MEATEGILKNTDTVGNKVEPITLRILKTTLHQIDIGTKASNSIEMTGDLADLNEYLGTLLSELREKTERRSYKFERDTTEFYVALALFGKTHDLENGRCDSLAKRLLAQEIKTEERYSQLATKKTGQLLQKGSFLQFLYQDDSGLGYLGVKLEHQTFVDEHDFKKHSGLPNTSKVYKACHVFFNDEGLPDLVQAYDTNSQPAAYWWKEFLELEVLRNDEHNTSTAVKCVVRTIGSIKKEFPHDYTVLRNATIAAFKQKGRMNYIEFVEKTFDKYEPHNPELNKNKAALIERLKNLPEKHNFDTQFELIPGAVDFRRTKIDLTPEISLSFEPDIKDIDSKIWSEKTKEGKKLIVINSDEAFEKFKIKERI